MSRIRDLEGQVRSLQTKVATLGARVDQQERQNIESALAARAVLAPLEQRLTEARERLDVVLKDEALVRAEVDEAEQENQLVYRSGLEHEAEMKSEMSEARSRAASAEQATQHLAMQYEEEVLSLLSRVAIFEKRRAELQRKLQRATGEQQAGGRAS